MNAIHSNLLIGLVLALSMVAMPAIIQAQSTPPAAVTPPLTATQAPVYKPPMLGAPATRVGGASRGHPGQWADSQRAGSRKHRPDQPRPTYVVLVHFQSFVRAAGIHPER
ncbi:MAG: hypothetical protein IPL59_02215 [Candidatus Competibacteraceae bacterium]|nr:hypothetical protein [Candidatus Competibacteraceae bacterium]